MVTLLPLPWRPSNWAPPLEDKCWNMGGGALCDVTRKLERFFLNFAATSCNRDHFAMISSWNCLLFYASSTFIHLDHVAVLACLLVMALVSKMPLQVTCKERNSIESHVLRPFSQFFIVTISSSMWMKPTDFETHGCKVIKKKSALQAMQARPPKFSSEKWTNTSPSAIPPSVNLVVLRDLGGHFRC